MIPIDQNFEEIVQKVIEQFAGEKSEEYKSFVPLVATYIRSNFYKNDKNRDNFNFILDDDIDSLIDQIESQINEIVNIAYLMKTIDQEKLPTKKINETFKPLIINILIPLKNRLIDTNEKKISNHILKINDTKNIIGELPNIVNYLLPQSRKILKRDNEKILLSFLNSKINNEIKEKFINAHYSDSAFSAIKVVEDELFKIQKKSTGKEITGRSLVNATIKKENTDFVPTDIEFKKQTKENIQEGFKLLFEGSMVGVRNLLAHEDIEIDRESALHYLFLSSLLLRKLQKNI